MMDHPQIRAWINNNLTLMEFWNKVVADETHEGLNKTREEAINLAGYFEGCYDMACNARDLISKLNEESKDASQ